MQLVAPVLDNVALWRLPTIFYLPAFPLMDTRCHSIPSSNTVARNNLEHVPYGFLWEKKLLKHTLNFPSKWLSGMVAPFTYSLL